MSDNTLPVHPLTGLRAIGYTRRGPVWPVLGGSVDSTEGTETGTEETSTEQQNETKAELPDDHPLVKTLAAQKAEIKDLKAKAKRLDEIEESQKTQAQKDADRIAKAEAEVAAVPAKVAELLKTHLVELHGIADEDAELFLTASDPELLLKQVTRLVGQPGKRKNTNRVPGEGTTNHSKPSSTQDFLNALTGQG